MPLPFRVETNPDPAVLEASGLARICGPYDIESDTDEKEWLLRAATDFQRQKRHFRAIETTDGIELWAVPYEID